MPKHGICILFFFIFCSGKLSAQTLNWANIFTIGNGGANSMAPYIRDMKADNEGNIIVAGEYGLNDSLNRKQLPKFNYSYLQRGISFLAKFDTAGHLLWMDTTMGVYSIQHIEISSKGDYFFSGSGADTGSTFNCPPHPSNNSTGFIGKCDRNGRMYWIRKYIDYHVRPAYSYDEGILNFKVDSMENVYFTAQIPGIPDFMVINATKYPNVTDSGRFLAKFDSTGKFVWLNTGINNDQLALDGLGNMYCFANYHHTVNIVNATVVNKYNNKGTLIKQLVFDSADKNVTLAEITTDKFDDIYIYMISNTDFTLNGYTYHNKLGTYLFKLDTGFNVVWSLNCGLPGGTISINKESDYLYLSEYGYQSQINLGGQSTQNVPGDSIGNAIFAKINLNGKVAWIKNSTYSKLFGYIPIIIEDKCGNFFADFNFSKIHFDGLNIGGANPNPVGSVIARFSSDSIGFVNQNSSCGLSLKNTSKPIFIHFQWYAKDVGDTTIGKLIATTKDLNYLFPHKHKYIITLLAVKSGGCTNTVQDTFNVAGSPVAGYNAIDTQGCQYVQFLFSDTSHADTINAAIGQSWYWDFGDGSAPLTYVQTKRPVVSHVYTKSGTYTVTLVYGNGFCSDTFVSQKKVVIIPAPKPGFSVSDTLGCVPLNVSVTDGSVGQVSKWVYLVGAASANAMAGKRDSIKSPSFSYSFSVPGVYIIHQYLTGPTGCVTEDSVLINVTPVFSNMDKMDIADATVDTTGIVDINWTVYPGATSYDLYRYTDNDTSTSALITQTNTTIYQDNSIDPGRHSYAYFIKAEDGCGHFTGQGRIGKTIKLSGFENGDLLSQLVWTPYKDWPGGVSNYKILREDPGSSFKSIGNANDTSFEDMQTQDIYGECYRVMATSNDSAQISFSNVFCFSNAPQIFIPDIFTPNGDTLNDLFTPVCMGIKEWNMTIINRWDEKVYEKTIPLPLTSSSGQASQGGFASPAAGWDGMFKGIICPNGVYIYYIKALDYNGNTIIRQGKIMLQQ